MKIKSPCINVCRAKDGVCVGCKRTVEEIKHWRGHSNAEKRAVLDRIQKETRNGG